MGKGEGNQEVGRSPLRGSGHQPTASALRASQSGVPNAGTLFRQTVRHCQCGSARVDTSDFAARVPSGFIAHGLFHCFAGEN
jgi:hypothetical protein